MLCDLAYLILYLMLYLLQTVDYTFYVMFRDAVMSNVVLFLPISQFFFHVDFPSPVVERFADGLHWWVRRHSGQEAHLAKTLEPRGFPRVAAGFSSYDGESRLPLVLAQEIGRAHV